MHAITIDKIKVWKNIDDTVIATIYAYTEDRRSIAGGTGAVLPAQLFDALQEVVQKMQETGETVTGPGYTAKKLPNELTSGPIKAQ